MILTTVFEVEINIDDLVAVYEGNTWGDMYPSGFESFYTYWLKCFEIFSEEKKAAAWRQNKLFIKQEYEYSMSRKR